MIKFKKKNSEGMKRHYNELMNTNRDIIQGYKIRSSNHEELLKHVKTLNQVVQRAGNLRGICVYFTSSILIKVANRIKKQNFVEIL